MATLYTQSIKPKITKPRGHAVAGTACSRCIRLVENGIRDVLRQTAGA
jgi:hypothetical protein